jgi:hypothetical protein
VSEYTEADLPICRARERQLIQEAESCAREARHARERDRMTAEYLRVQEWASYRAATRERLAK